MTADPVLEKAPILEELEVVGTLSPSRASDFKTCPLLYRFRTIDQLPEPPSPEAVRGTLVHAVLERLYDLPAAERTPEAAEGLIESSWLEIQAAEPEIAELFKDSAAAEADWLGSVRPILAGYFALEDPTRLAPSARELFVEVLLPTGLRLRGFVDRLDEAPTGELRVVDYKTGKAPGANYESKALFQLKFYALVIWRTHGRVPRELRLLYLADREVLRYTPHEAELRAFERQLEALWRAIDRARVTRDWRPSPGPLCNWCAHQAICPAYGGTPPPLPEETPVAEVPASA